MSTAPQLTSASPPPQTHPRTLPFSSCPGYSTPEGLSRRQNERTIGDLLSYIHPDLTCDSSAILPVGLTAGRVLGTLKSSTFSAIRLPVPRCVRALLSTMSQTSSSPQSVPSAACCLSSPPDPPFARRAFLSASMILKKHSPS